MEEANQMMDCKCGPEKPVVVFTMVDKETNGVEVMPLGVTYRVCVCPFCGAVERNQWGVTRLFTNLAQAPAAKASPPPKKKRGRPPKKVYTDPFSPDETISEIAGHED